MESKVISRKEKRERRRHNLWIASIAKEQRKLLHADRVIQKILRMLPVTVTPKEEGK